ncbi:hypothetical protein N0V84_006413 [Fusarium piperis]|uniref:Uncharacterized protein n=1 Tax=Fusarium piperis TaxID=1435070 RepID=A0A9W8WC19_9HYPO|nr:hypothetical protein N0V84_006413 [Fusarium piperis]
MPPLPTIRLQVWYHSNFAPTHQENILFANFLGSWNIGSWDVQPVQVLTGAHWNQNFVPIEVDIKYRPTSFYNLAEASTSLCRFFENDVAAHVGEFFRRFDTTALLVNMYPLGQSLTDEVRAMFLRVKLLRPLGLNSSSYTESYPLLNHSIATEVLHQAASMPIRAFELGNIWAAGDLDALKDKSLNMQSLLQERQDSPLPKEVLEAWNKSFVSLRVVRLLFKKIQICIVSSRSEDGASTQTLYTCLVLIREVIVQFSDFQKSSDLVIRHLQVVHGTRVQASREIITTLGGLLSLFMTYFRPSPVTAAGLSLGGALLVGAISLPQLFERLGNRKALNKYGDAMRGLQSDLRMAQFGLAILFCNQAFQIPFPWLADGRGTELLESLGVDVSELKGEEYSRGFALDSLESLSQSYGRLEELRNDIGQRAGLKDCMEAAMPSSSPDGNPDGNGEPMDCEED